MEMAASRSTLKLPRAISPISSNSMGRHDPRIPTSRSVSTVAEEEVRDEFCYERCRHGNGSEDEDDGLPMNRIKPFGWSGGHAHQWDPSMVCFLCWRSETEKVYAAFRYIFQRHRMQ